MLAEETESGVAGRPRCGSSSEMRTVQGWLAERDASPRTIRLEKRIEQDLLSLLEAMRRLPPATPPPPGSPLPSDLRAPERELNRLIAELKMIRMLQSRLNDDTIVNDGAGPRSGDPPARSQARDRGPQGVAGRDPRLAPAELRTTLEPSGDPNPTGYFDR